MNVNELDKLPEIKEIKINAWLHDFYAFSIKS